MRQATEAFKTAFARGDCSPIVIARLYFRDLDSGPGVKSWDVSSGTIDGFQNSGVILGESTYGLKEVLLGMSQLSSKLDPKTRAISSGDLSLTVNGWDSVFNKLVPIPSLQSADQTWDNKLVRVYLAEKTLTNVLDWLPIFHGFIDDVILQPESDNLEFNCKTVDEMFSAEAYYGGTFHTDTPLETSRSILNYAVNLKSLKKLDLTVDGDINGQSFDQSNPGFTGTDSWAVTNLGVDMGGINQFTGTIGEYKDYNLNEMRSDSEKFKLGNAPLNSEFPGALPQNASRRGMAAVLPLVNMLLRPYMASVYIDGGGVVKCNVFDATTVTTFNKGQYRDFSQSTSWSGSVINKLIMEQDSPDSAGGPFTFTYYNQASIDKFGESTSEFPSFPFMRSRLMPFRRRTSGTGASARFASFWDSPYVQTGQHGTYFTHDGLLGMTGIKTSPASSGDLGYGLYGPFSEVFSFDDVSRVTPETSDFDTVSWANMKSYYFQYTPQGYLKVISDLENDPGYPANLLQSGGSPVTGTSNGSDKIITLSANSKAISGIDSEKIQPYDSVAFRDSGTGAISSWYPVSAVIDDGQIALRVIPAAFVSNEVLIRRNTPFPNLLETPRTRSVNVVARNVNNTGAPAEGLKPKRGTPIQPCVYDVTQAYHYGEKLLNRFTTGAPTAKVSVPLEFSYLEIGDVIELEDEEIAWEGYDSTAAIKWEITSVEYNPLGDAPHIELSLCVAEHSAGAPFYDYITLILPYSGYVSPTDGASGRPEISRPPNPFGYDSHMRENIGILGGCGPSVETVANRAYPTEIIIEPGTISNGALGIPFECDLLMGEVDANGQPLSEQPYRNFGNKLRMNREMFQADRDYLIYSQLQGQGLTVLEVDSSDPSSFLDVSPSHCAPICSFSTDANGDPDTTSLFDFRSIGSLYHQSVLPSKSGGANLDFEDFTTNTGFPDNWTGSSVEFGDAARRSMDSPRSGKSCLHFNMQQGENLTSSFMEVKENQPYKLTAWHNPLTVNSKVIQTFVAVVWYDDKKNALSPANLLMPLSGVSVGTWYKNSSQATSNASACYAKISLLRFGATSGQNKDDAILIDSLSLELVGAPKEERGEFVDLADTPNDYTGSAGKVSRVDSSNNAMEFARLDHYSRFWTTQATTTITKNTTTQVLFNSKSDPDSAFSTTSSRWTCPFDGAFRIEWNIYSQIDPQHFVFGGIILRFTNETTSTDLIDDGPQERYHNLAHIFAGSAVFDFSAGDELSAKFKETLGYDITYRGSSGGYLDVSQLNGTVVTITSVRTD